MVSLVHAMQYGLFISGRGREKPQQLSIVAKYLMINIFFKRYSLLYMLDRVSVSSTPAIKVLFHHRKLEIFFFFFLEFDDPYLHIHNPSVPLCILKFRFFLIQHLTIVDNPSYVTVELTIFVLKRKKKKYCLAFSIVLFAVESISVNIY